MTLLSHALAEGEDRMPETDAERQATHWAGCEQVHHACALAKLERVTTERDALIDSLIARNGDRFDVQVPFDAPGGCFRVATTLEHTSTYEAAVRLVRVAAGLSPSAPEPPR